MTTMSDTRNEPAEIARVLADSSVRGLKSLTRSDRQGQTIVEYFVRAAVEHEVG